MSRTKKLYKAPKTHPVFVETWKTLLPEITTRDNFKPGFLRQLSMLCDLYVEYDILTETVQNEGYTYTSDGRNGEQIHHHPALSQLNKTRMEIRTLSKHLGLVLYRDVALGNSKEEEEEWE